MNPAIFREYDIRGIANKDFDANFARNLGRAYVEFAQERLQKKNLNICVGRDCRLTGEEMTAAILTGLTEAGASVANLGMVTTPITYFTPYVKNFDGSIMVTGSHNPPDYNGFKICVDKASLFGADIQDLRRRMEAQSQFAATPIKPLSAFEPLAILEEYKAYIKSNITLARKLKIVVDAGNGTAGPIAPLIYRLLGCEVIELFCEPDGRFPNHEADPTVTKNLQDLMRAVREHSADAGIAFDGDADRIGVVNEKGEILWGDELMVLFARDVLKKNPGATIISEVKSSHRLYQDIEKNGGKGIMWKTGHSLIKAKIKETKAALAGEMSGHIFFADRFFGFDDAIYAGSRFLEILANSKQSVSALLADLPKTVNTPEIRVDCEDNKKWDVIAKIKARLIGKHKVNDIDGVRVEFADGWGLVRASNTQPMIVMRFEAETAERLAEIKNYIEAEARAAGLVV